MINKAAFWPTHSYSLTVKHTHMQVFNNSSKPNVITFQTWYVQQQKHMPCILFLNVQTYVLSFPWAVAFSWARYSPPALKWPRSDRLFQAPAAAGLLSRPSLFLLEPGRRYGFFPSFPCFTKALWTILEYFEIWLYLVQLSIFKFI